MGWGSLAQEWCGLPFGGRIAPPPSQVPLAVWIAPPALATAGVLAIVYTIALHRVARQDPAAWRRRWAGWLGCVLLYAGVSGPLAVLAEGYLVTAHMIQMGLLVYGAAPTLVVGCPAAWWRAVWAHRVGRAVARRLTHPVVSLLLLGGVMAWVAWPPFLTLMETAPLVHLAYHGACLVAGMAAWWPYASPLPERPAVHPGLQMLYATVSALPMLLIFAPIALDTAPFYPYYAHAPRVFGLSPVADQQLGAITMLVGSHIPAAWLFVRGFQAWWRLERGPADGLAGAASGAPPPADSLTPLLEAENTQSG